MLENDDDPSKTFNGVRYVLFGFDPVYKDKIQSKLLEGGGIDAVNYGRNCTHVIVHKLVYNDDICVRAIKDGKILVTGLWVDHSFDAGMPVDHTLVMYRPMRDLNGIPGAKSLIICLTGYMRQDRDDIMTMVGLMGATFSKPLVANKVTHLICYKFEGEKYELAKKMKKIKLINHFWLEDCLKAWDILPETDYAKSGYELEMEAEAKDSEEETEDVAAITDVGRQNVVSPQNTRGENRFSHQSPLKHEVSRNSLLSSASKSLANIGDTSKVQSTPENKKGLGNASFLEACHPRHLSSASKSLENIGDTSKIQSPVRNKDLENESFKGDFHDDMLMTSRNISSEVPPCRLDGTMMSKKVDNALAAASDRSKKSPGAQLSKSFSRSTPTKPSISLSSERAVNNSGKPSATTMNNVGVSGCSTMPLETHLKGIDFVGVRTPSKGSNLQLDEQNVSLPEKKKMTLSRGSSKSPKVSHGLEKSVESMSKLKSKEVLASGFPVSPRMETRHLSEEASLAPNESKRKAPTQYEYEFKKRTLSTDLKSKDHSLSPTDNPTGEVEIQDIEPPFLQTTVCGADKSIEKTDLSISSLQHTESNKPKKKLLARKTLGPRLSMGKGSISNSKGSISLKKTVLENEHITHSNGASATKEIDDDIYTVKVSTPTTVTDKSQTTHHEPQNEVNDEAKPVDDETDATDDIMENVSDGVTNKEKYTKDEAPYLGNNIVSEKRAGANDTGNQPDGKITGKKLKVAKSVEEKNNVTAEEALRSKEVEMIESKSTADALEKKSRKGKKCSLAKTKAKILKDPVMEAQGGDSTTEAEEGLLSKEVEMIESKSVGDVSKRKGTKGKKSHLAKTEGKIYKDPVEEAKRDESSTEAKEALQSKEVEMIESKSMGDVSKRKGTKGKKSLLATTEGKIYKDAVEVAERNESSVKEDRKKSLASKEGTVALADKNKTRPSKKLKSSSDAEKENKLVEIVNQSVSNDTGAARKASQPLQKSSKTGLNADNSNLNPVKTGPPCFIMCGHKLQRKEYQQVIKRLKGKLCRDTHSWSYQATHFIVPDPIRRTEKFFAAAVSGSWILTTDYLTACDKAGKFLPEEPYEWHKKSLNEDGAINLEAPRKWRLLKERTGHGAFYGMCIVIYGECIAPPLDTLKRVVKAGGGTIYATSPPYTRFLQKGIDFAIVSPGMPRVDMWVQEFLSHEVPCVLADYLVEYICKPGYSLDQHVQYNTHSWAEKSLKNLCNRLEEEVIDEPRTPVIEEPRTPVEEDNSDDVACQVCESRDRGDAMLICGNESGTLGCGIGTHFDCLDPPLEDVPEEDWFCPSCSEKQKRKVVHQSSIKRSSKSKK